MEKGDVEMEDAEKKTQDVPSKGQELLDASIGHPGDKAQQSTDHSDQMPNEMAVEEQRNDEDSLEAKTSSKIEGEDHKVRSEGQDQNNVKGGVDDQNEVKHEEECLSSKTLVADQHTSTRSMPGGQSKIRNESEDLIVPENQTNSRKEVEEQTNAGSETGDHNNAKSEMKDQHDGGSVVVEQKESENGEENINSDEDDKKNSKQVAEKKTLGENGQLHVDLPTVEVPQNKERETVADAYQSEQEKKIDEAHQIAKEVIVDEQKVSENAIGSDATISDMSSKLIERPETKTQDNDTNIENKQEPDSPNMLVKCSTEKAGELTGETFRSIFDDIQMAEDDDGTLEDQAAFMKELESFYREKAMEFKPPKFYGQPLNCLKLWRSVIRLGGYDRVTGSKLWRQVGESFHPPKTCTTVSWTFRIFYEKALLEYERHKRQNGELQLPLVAVAEPSGVDNEGNGFQSSGSGRARRDAAARAMQGWHVQRLFGYGEVGEPIVKDKSLNNIPKREKNLKSIGSLKTKRPNEAEHPVKAARTETSKQLVTTVVDVGPPADWVKINVRETKDCFEVYALVPGLLREEVRVQSDPAGRLVITGQPEQPDNPWGITAFKKVVSLPARIDPLQTSAVVSLHGRLFVRVPFEQPNI